MPAWSSSRTISPAVRSRPFPRATTSQKCVRAGGKHNDLDNVGYTARHHTFFEMLGNFSFGDYFKEQAIELAWQLITKEFGLPKDKLTATVYIDDDQAFDLWRKISGLPESRIIRIAGSDNFSADGRYRALRSVLGDILRPRRGNSRRPARGSPDADGDRFIEVWNLVFMQFEQLPGGERIDLPRPSIDTGMGLERIAAVLQGVHDNYDIDLFRTLIAASVDLIGVPCRGEGSRQPPRHRRPSACRQLYHRRWRAAVQRGPRLCAAPHHAARHAPRPSARRRRIRSCTGWCRCWSPRWAAPIPNWCGPNR